MFIFQKNIDRSTLRQRFQIPVEYHSLLALSPGGMPVVVEAHHIEPFISSLNNDSTNQIILSPSYHRIVHQANPRFDRSQLAFIFPNGLVERVKVNKHL